MNKKIIALLLAVLMAAPVIVSCGDDSDTDKETQNTTAQTTVETEEENEYAEIDAYVDDLASQFNYDGVTFTIVGSTGMTIFPEAKEINGNLENDALYSRIRDIEDKFGVTFEFDESTGDDYENTGAETSFKVDRDVMAGTATYDLIEGDLGTVGQNLLGAGRIRAVDTGSYIDFSKSWWVEDIEERLGIGGKLYFMTGKINPTHFNEASAMLFNKEVATNFNIASADLYELVDNGEWTFDKMNEVASVVTAGSGIKRYLVGYSQGMGLYMGAGFVVTEQDEDGNPAIATTLSSDAVDYIDKMATVFGDTSTVFNTKYNSAEPDESKGQFYDRQEFEDGNVLFWIDGVGRAIDLREEGFDAEFGILPIPKKDTAQEDYISAAGGRAVYFSKAIKDEEMSYVITEAMAALSEKYLEPAFYEKALMGRSTSDVESRRVLDIVYNSKAIDLASIYEWGEVTDIIGKAIVKDKESYISDYNSSSKLAKNEIKQLLKAVEKDEN